MISEVYYPRLKAVQHMTMRSFSNESSWDDSPTLEHTTPRNKITK